MEQVFGGILRDLPRRVMGIRFDKTLNEQLAHKFVSDWTLGKTRMIARSAAPFCRGSDRGLHQSHARRPLGGSSPILPSKADLDLITEAPHFGSRRTRAAVVLFATIKKAAASKPPSKIGVAVLVRS